MQNIRSSNTEPERIIFRELRRRKTYFARHVKTLVGKPDIVFRRKKVAVFIDSDFWHGHPKRFIRPSSNTEYWDQKIQRNRARDKEVNRILESEGWRVLRFWEHDVRKHPDRVINKVLLAIEA